MKTTILLNRELTDSELFTIDRFSYYFDCKKAFVLIGDSSVVVIDGQKEHKEMIVSATKSMSDVLNSHPDFSSYVMDDGNALVEMNENVFGLMEGDEADISKTDEKVPLAIALAIRANCLKAAEMAECIAIVEPA